MMLPTLYNALARGTDPDRMKGALYILYDKEIGTKASFYMQFVSLTMVVTATYAIAGTIF